MKISTVEAIELLSQHFLNVLIIDVCKKPSNILPGARYFPFLCNGGFRIKTVQNKTVIEETFNGFTIPNNLDVVEDSVFQMRIGSHVLVFDEDGLGISADICEYIKQEGTSLSCFYLKNGIRELKQKYPQLTKSSSISTNINHSLLGSLENIDISSLYKLQKELIDGVWFNKGKQIGDILSEIIPDFLYLSSCHACNEKQINANKISHVVRIGWGFETDCTTVIFHDFPIADSPHAPILNHLDQAIDIIEQCRINGKRVLVHCHAGVSRSPTVILAYLIKYGGMSLYHAWNQVYRVRPIIRPNFGFGKALQQFEQRYFDRISLSLFWMSESYFYYMDYIEFMYRFASLI